VDYNFLYPNIYFISNSIGEEINQQTNIIILLVPPIIMLRMLVF
jgi:hypothetical protein